MALYEYTCPTGHDFAIKRSMCEPAPNEVICLTHNAMAEWKPSLFRIKFEPTIGRDSGIYALDYGKRATEDLTVPGKFDRLRRDGVVCDPFLDFAEGNK